MANATLSRLGVVDQVRLATNPRNRLASTIGGLLGAVVPIMTYWIAHYEHTGELRSIHTALVAGGLAYSAPTVFQWAHRALQSRLKAAGFVVLVEGVMLASGTPWLTLLGLAVLVAINATATGCNLATEARPQRKPWAKAAPRSGRRLKAVA